MEYREIWNVISWLIFNFEIVVKLLILQFGTNFCCKIAYNLLLKSGVVSSSTEDFLSHFPVNFNFNIMEKSLISTFDTNFYCQIAYNLLLKTGVVRYTTEDFTRISRLFLTLEFL
jgi:hypothetical protein